MAPYPQKRFLADVVGFAGIANDALGDTNGTLHVTPHQDAESMVLARGDRRHQRLIRWVLHHLGPYPVCPAGEAARIGGRQFIPYQQGSHGCDMTRDRREATDQKCQ